MVSTTRQTPIVRKVWQSSSDIPVDMLHNEHMCWIEYNISRVSCQKGPTRHAYARHAYAWQIGSFWQDTLDIPSYGQDFRVLVLVSL